MPQLFPTSYSTFCPNALGQLISEKYGFERAECQMLIRGVGDTYAIRAQGEKYILRVYRSPHRSLAQITAETELLLALKQAAVPVSYPIQDLSGKVIQPIQAAEGERYAVLFSFAPGRSVQVLNERQLQSLGHQMARFHSVSSTIELSDQRWHFNLETTLFKPLEMVKPFFEEYPEDYAWLCEAADKANKKLSQLNTAAFPAGYCHFDFLPKNFHFEEDAITFFDFDFFGYGWLVNDVMTFWQQLCLDVHLGRMTQEHADNAYATFLDAYQEYRPLSKDELAAVPYLGLGFWLFYLGFYTTHDQFYPLLHPPHLKMRTALIRQLTERNWHGEG